MLCQKCSQNEATIHYFESINGKSQAMNFCDSCAASAEMGGMQISVQFVPLVSQTHSADAIAYETLMAKPQGELTCVGCGMRLEEFLREDSYRCQACRDTFRHVSTRSKDGGKSTAELKAQLEEAVAAEDFELAAKLRDKLQETGHV